MLFLDVDQLKWAAGLFDGEGTVGVRRSGPRAHVRRIGLAVGMTDLEVVQRFQRAIGGIGSLYINCTQSKYPNAKPVHRFVVHSFQNTQYIIALLWHWLSGPKREQAKRALEAWKAERHRYHDKRLFVVGGKNHSTIRTT